MSGAEFNSLFQVVFLLWIRLLIVGFGLPELDLLIYSPVPFFLFNCEGVLLHLIPAKEGSVMKR
jgi:hypothetical protein